MKSIAARRGTIQGSTSTPAAYLFVLWGSWREDARTIFLPLFLETTTRGSCANGLMDYTRGGMATRGKENGGAAERNGSAQRNCGAAATCVFQEGLGTPVRRSGSAAPRQGWTCLGPQDLSCVLSSSTSTLDHQPMGRGPWSVGREDNLRSRGTCMLYIVQRFLFFLE